MTGDELGRSHWNAAASCGFREGSEGGGADTRHTRKSGDRASRVTFGTSAPGWVRTEESMRKEWIVGTCALAMSVAGMMGCGDDTLVVKDAGGADSSVETDSGTPVEEAGSPDATTEADAGADAAEGGDADAVAPVATRLLLSYNTAGQSELAAFGLQSGQVDGRLLYPASFGTTATTWSSPWLLEQSNDVVARLDPIQPWKVRSSWNVALSDQTDAGFAEPYADPDAVVVGAGTKAYVLRYTRNLVAVIDTSADVDGGAPMKTIDLSGQVQAAGDGYVEMTAGFFDATSNRVYVLLGNINRFDVACGGYCQLCSATSPTLVAIDTNTDQLVPLADAGADAGSGWTLQGYAPAFGPAAMVYDAANARLLVLHAGCNQPDADGGAGPLVKRGVEAVSLVDGSTKMLLDLTSSGFPQGIYYVDQHHVLLQLDQTYAWDPASSSLGPALASAPMAFTLDGKGNLLGVNEVTAADGGYGGWQVVSVSASDGGVTPLGTADPFTLSNPNGFAGGVQLWPAP